MTARGILTQAWPFLGLCFICAPVASRGDVLQDMAQEFALQGRVVSVLETGSLLADIGREKGVTNGMPGVVVRGKPGLWLARVAVSQVWTSACKVAVVQGSLTPQSGDVLFLGRRDSHQASESLESEKTELLVSNHLAIES